MVMRGDGGATDLEGFRAHPARTLYSGPAASVAGALRSRGHATAWSSRSGARRPTSPASGADAPSLSYVQVASHATAVRAVDVRVVGVAGGSMLRVRGRRVYGVGPRSAHIAGLRYACYRPARAPSGGRRGRDRPARASRRDYLIVRGRRARVALTNTCAAAVLGIVERRLRLGRKRRPGRAFAWPGALRLAVRGGPAHARGLGHRGSASWSRPPPPTISSRSPVAGRRGRRCRRRSGARRRHAGHPGAPCPHRAEVISSIGDALSLIRV